MIAVTRTPLAVAPDPDDRVYSPAKLLAVVEALAVENVPPEAALAGTGLTSAALAAPRARVSLTDTLAVYGNAAKLSADPMFAKRVGASMHVSAYGMYGFAILSSIDFRHTMQFVTAYHQLATPLTDLRLDEAAASPAGPSAPWRTRSSTSASRVSSLKCSSGCICRFIATLWVQISTSMSCGSVGPSPATLRAMRKLSIAASASAKPQTPSCFPPTGSIGRPR